MHRFMFTDYLEYIHVCVSIPNISGLSMHRFMLELYLIIMLPDYLEFLAVSFIIYTTYHMRHLDKD